MMMIDELLKKVCQSLEANHIPYMLSGSVAIGFYAVARTTRDIDIVIELNQSDIDKFLSGFSGFYFNKASVKEEVKRLGMFNLIDNQTGYKIDFIVRKNDEYAAEAFSRRRRLDGNGFPVCVISIEDLIIAKITWIQDFESDRQISDIKNLLLNPQIDMNYLAHWIKKLKLKTYGLIYQ